jgi:hypothetical protein
MKKKGLKNAEFWCGCQNRPHQKLHKDLISNRLAAKFSATHIFLLLSFLPFFQIFLSTNNINSIPRKGPRASFVFVLILCLQNTSTYIPRVPQCLSPRPNWDPLSPPASVSPPRYQRGGTLRGEGPNSDD